MMATLRLGGHQASSASMATIMTALYLKSLKPEDRVAVKPHASPIFHAIQSFYLPCGRSDDLCALSRCPVYVGGDSVRRDLGPRRAHTA